MEAVSLQRYKWLQQNRADRFGILLSLKEFNLWYLLSETVISYGKVQHETTEIYWATVQQGVQDS